MGLLLEGPAALDLLVAELRQIIQLLDLRQAFHLDHLADTQEDFLPDRQVVGHKLVVLQVVDFLVVGLKDLEVSRLVLEVDPVVSQVEQVDFLVVTVGQKKEHMKRATIRLFLVSLVLITLSILRCLQHPFNATNSSSLVTMPTWRHGAKFSTFVLITRPMTSCVRMAQSFISSISSVCGGINLTATVPLVYTG